MLLLHYAYSGVSPFDDLEWKAKKRINKIKIGRLRKQGCGR